MMKQNNIYKMMALGCLMMALPLVPSCTDDREPIVDMPRLTIAVSTESAGISRGIVEGGTLPDGSVIGLSLVDSDGSGYGNSDYGIFTATASTDIVPQVWTLGTDIVLDGTEGTLHAFYPYSDAVTDIKSVPVTSGSTDYMYAVPVTGLDNANSSADIVMRHALTAVRIKLGRGTYPGEGVVSSVVLSGDIAGSAVLDATTGLLSSHGGGAALDVTPEGTVTLSASPSLFTGMVIPTVETGDLTVSITLDGNPLTATLSDCDLTAGNLLNVNATLSGTEFVISSVTLDEWQNTTSVDLNGDRVPENLLAVYNVTSTTDATRILDSTTGISKMIIDGVELEPTTTYTFSSTGEHLVGFVLKYNYEIYNSTFRGCKQLNDVYIPNSVTTIGSSAFDGCTGLTSVTIPESVTSIESDAFNICKGLITIDLGTGVQTIGNGAFDGCTGLTSVTIPESVTNIGNIAFRSCKGLKTLDLGTGVETIGSSAFEGCAGLTSVTIPESVTNIGSVAFRYCTGVKSIVVDTANSKYDSRNDGNAIMETATNTLITGCKNTIIPEDTKIIGDYAFSDCTGLTGELVIPNSVTIIGENAFSDCTGLTGVAIPNGVETIGSSAFNGCTGLTGTLIIPNSVSSIGNFAFSNCTGLTGELVIPNSVKNIEYRAFYNCTGLKALDLGTGLRSIGDYAFYNCRIIEFVCRPINAPSVGTDSFGASTTMELGGSEPLYFLTVPTGATGYDTWITSLYTAMFGRNLWAIRESFTPTECISLSITADDVGGRSTSTLIHYTAVCNGVNNLTGETENNVTISRTVKSDDFSQNPSTTDSRQLTVSYTYMGVTASTTITQSPYVAAYYTVVLNNEWQNSSIANPDASLYDGVYESFSNYNVHNSGATMTIKVFGYTSFTVYIRSYAESSFDYVMASALDQTITYSTSYSNTTLVKAHTCGSQNSSTTIDSYKAVTYDIPDDGQEHTITIVYRKDGNSNSGTDRGYVLIGKP